MIRFAAITLSVALSAGAASAQTLTLPPSGDNQKASVTQHIGPVTVTVDYSSPDVHAPDGTDRRGRIWGTDVAHYGLANLGYGTCTECPWRAGANENTVFTTSHDITVEGSRLPAGRYGLHMILGAEEVSVIFSRDSQAWGSYFYDPSSDALRVTVKPRKNEYREWLTYEFTDRRPDAAVLELQWEELAIPIRVAVEDVNSIWLANIRQQIKGAASGDPVALANAARFALRNNMALDEAEQWADRSVNHPWAGQATWQNVSLLARLQEANGKADAAKKSWERAYALASPTDLHRRARELQAEGKTTEAIAVYELNANRNGSVWPTNVGLMRAWSAKGNLRKAAEFGRKAIAQAPDELNRNALREAVAQLESGKAL